MNKYRKKEKNQNQKHQAYEDPAFLTNTQENANVRYKPKPLILPFKYDKQVKMSNRHRTMTMHQHTARTGAQLAGSSVAKLMFSICKNIEINDVNNQQNQI